MVRDPEIHPLTSLEEVEACAPAWQALAAACGVTVFQTPAWALAWWKAFGTGSRLRLFALRSEGHLVGLAPFHVKTTRAGVRRLGVLGSPEADYGGLLAAPGAEAAVGQTLADRLYEDRTSARFQRRSRPSWSTSAASTCGPWS